MKPVFNQPFSSSACAQLVSLLQAQFTPIPKDYLPLILNGQHLGYLKPEWQEYLQRDWAYQIALEGNRLLLSADTALSLGDALQHLAQDWHRLGLFDGWRDERFDVLDEQGAPFFALERSAFRVFGLASHAVHVNGLSYQTGQWHFWIAKRSPFKAVAPNKLDTIVGGGVASGETIHEALARESWEEAGLAESLWAEAKEAACVLSLRPVARGLHREYLHIFDALLPEDTLPENQDGEVAGFALMNAEQLLAAMLANQLMNDALLATLNACARYGLILPDEPLYKLVQNSVSTKP